MDRLLAGCKTLDPWFVATGLPGISVDHHRRDTYLCSTCMTPPLCSFLSLRLPLVPCTHCFRALTAAVRSAAHTHPLTSPSLLQMSRRSPYKGRALPHRSHIGWQLPSINQRPHSVKFMGVGKSLSALSKHTGKTAWEEEDIIHIDKRKYSAYSIIKEKKGIPQYFNITRKCK